LTRDLRIVAVVVAGYALAGGIVSLAGWVLDLPRLTDWIGTGISIQPNTSIAVICAGLGVLGLLLGFPRASQVFGAITALIGTSVLFEWVSGVDLGLGTLFMFGRTWGRFGVLYPGRMGPPSAFSWAVLGTAVVLATRSAKARAAVPTLGLITACVASLSLIGHLYGADVLYMLPRLTIIALQTSTFILALSLGLVVSIPERSPMRRLTEDGVAGALVRRAVPIIVLLPVALGLLRLLGQRLGLYDLAFGTAIRTVLEIVLLLALLSWMAGTIRRQARREAEHRLATRTNEQRLAGLLGTMSDAFMTIDRSWRFTFVNDEGTALLRKTREELLGRNLWELYPEAADTEAHARLHEAMAERKAVEYEFLYAPWGRWFFTKAYPMGDGGLAVFSRDVTDRRAIDAALRLRERSVRDRERLLATVTENTKVGLVVVAPDHRYLYANQAYVDILGLPEREIVGRPVEQALRPQLERAFSGERVEYDLTLPAPREGALPRCIAVIYEPQSADEGVESVIVTVADVTERKQVEAALEAGERRFRTIFETVAVSHWEQDFTEVKAAVEGLRHEGVTDFREYFRDHPEFVERTLGLVRVLDVNPATVRLFKARNKAEVLASLRAIFGPASLPVLVDVLVALAEGKTSFESEASLQTVAGEPVHVFFTMVLPPPEESRPRVLLSVVDLTDRKLLEEERDRLLTSERRARGEAERASEVKDEFLATLSHELRTPLNAILGWVRLLEKRPSDSALAAEGIEVIARNARAQADLIADLLDMNRIISGKIRLDVDDVRLSEVIEAAIDTIRPAAESKQIRLHAVLSPLGDPVRGDATRLQQVMWNLLSNAVKFTPKGGRIQVMLMKTDSYAEIVVSDSGMGISPKFLPLIFDRFRQGDASTTREHGGLGLGLAIVKQLVELHGGAVRGDSAGEGQGATFTITLPLALMARPRPGAEARAARTRMTDDVNLEGITVLAVEDQADARELLRIVLERSRARVLTAGSVDEALGMLERARPAIILCDIGMPGRDGYDFIAELRRRNDDTPALAVTAFARTEDKIRALQAGYHGHIAKPIEPAELLSTVAVLARAGKH
jgi:PAS domain S-box-containing protein